MFYCTKALAVVTAGLAIFTALLYATTRRVGIEALAASTKATETLVGMERAYLTGGGDIENRVGQRCFRVDVANYERLRHFCLATVYALSHALRWRLGLCQPSGGTLSMIESRQEAE
jgi:hypothetical protein